MSIFAAARFPGRVSTRRNQKGMPCESATVPAAVSFGPSGQLRTLFATGFGREGVAEETSQKTCLAKDVHLRVTGRSQRNEAWISSGTISFDRYDRPRFTLSLIHI